LLIVRPLADVFGALSGDVDAKAFRHPVFHLTLVNISVDVRDVATALRQVVVESTVVFLAAWIDLLPHSASQPILELT